MNISESIISRKRNFFACFFLLWAFIVFLSCTQKKKPLPWAGLHKLTVTEIKNRPIHYNNTITYFREDAQKLDAASLGNYLSNDRFLPEVYTDKEGIIKLVVFVRKAVTSPVDTNTTKSTQPPPFVDKTGKVAPHFAVRDMDGHLIVLSSLKGKVVVLNFWFIGCIPCVAEMGALNSLKKEYSNKNVAFLAITFNKRAAVQEFLKHTPFEYTMIPDAKEILNSWQAQVFPTNIVINQSGIVRLQIWGFQEHIEEKLSKALDSLL